MQCLHSFSLFPHCKVISKLCFFDWIHVYSYNCLLDQQYFNVAPIISSFIRAVVQRKSTTPFQLRCDNQPESFISCSSLLVNFLKKSVNKTSEEVVSLWGALSVDCYWGSNRLAAITSFWNLTSSKTYQIFSSNQRYVTIKTKENVQTSVIIILYFTILAEDKRNYINLLD